MEISFTKVKLPYGWLGNMSPHPVVFDGVTYKTAEHIFQILRLPPWHTAIEEILKEASPMAAKLVAKKYEGEFIVKACSDEDVENMLLVLFAKLKTNPELVPMLLETGDEKIYEDCTNRQRGNGLFWGAAKIDDVWTGQNVLGELWCIVRDKIRNEQKNSQP